MARKGQLMAIHLKRTPTILEPDQSRVLLRPFSPGNPERVAMVMARIMAISEDGVGPILEAVSAEFSERHQQIRNLFLERCEQVCELVATTAKLSEQRRLLIGSYFLTEHPLPPTPPLH